MSARELRALSVESIHRAMLGPHFRHDNPVDTMGGVMGQLIKGFGINDYADYRRALGKLEGLQEALAAIQDGMKALNDPPGGTL